MTDPAVEAVRRLRKRQWLASTNECIFAAREALKPIRELHHKTDIGSTIWHCLRCKTTWPCETAKLIYATEELQ